MKNARRNRRNGGNTDASTDAGDTTSSGGASDSDESSVLPGFESDSSAGGNDGPTSEVGNSDDELPIDSERSPDVRSQRRGSASRGGKQRASSGDSDARPATGTETAETRQGSDSQAVPRNVGFDSLGGGKKSKSAAQEKFNQTFIAEGFGLLFYGLSKVFNDDVWEIPQDEALELSDRFSFWLKSGGSKRVANFERMVAKHGPAISLGIGIVAVVGPRIAHTRRKRGLEAIQKKQAAAAAAARGPATPVDGLRTAAGFPPPATESGAAVVPEVDSNREGPANNVVGNGGPPSPVSASHRSLRREAFTQFFPESND